MGVITLLLFLLPFHLHLFKYADSKCPESFQCGNYTLSFPLTKFNDPGCGLITVDDCDLDPPLPIIRVGGGSYGYRIVAQNSENNLSVYDNQLDALLKNHSCFSFNNLPTLLSPFFRFSISPSLNMYPCSTAIANQLQIDERFLNYSRVGCGSSTVYYKIPAAGDSDSPPEVDLPDGCSCVFLPMKSSRNSSDLFDIVTANFTLQLEVTGECVNCFGRGGKCSLTNNDNLYCSEEKPLFEKISFMCGMALQALSVSLGCIFTCIQRKRAKAKRKRDRDIKLFLENNANLAPMRYKYSTIKKMTNSFSEILGRGGFGSVYKGKLADGHLVAVKVLSESNGNGEDFMNEVASISRTSHINIVALLGFCFEGLRRALVYDFMPNRSLEKFIGNNVSSSQESRLGFDKLFEIALGIARGLEYLHQGCNTRILHLDIKPQNILLDKDMNPRISDFGLAKLCPNRSSVVSMMETRGTIGYIAPEVFSRNFGEVSYKSDVYSYGMLVLEMVGGRRNIDPRDVDCSSEVYFPHYLYKQLEMNAEKDGNLDETMIEEDEEGHSMKRNLIIVGLWCVQTNPKDRPTMTKVVEMLEGKFGSLEAPPKPQLYSPPAAAPSFTISESL